MDFLKKIIIGIILISLLLPKFGLAQEEKIFSVLENIQKFLFGLVLSLAVIFFIYAGFLFLTAQGRPDAIETAKKALFWGLIGVLVAFLARGLVEIIKAIVGFR